MWNRQTQSEVNKKTRQPKKFKGILAFVLVAALAVVVCWLVRMHTVGDKTNSPETKSIGDDGHVNSQTTMVTSAFGKKNVADNSKEDASSEDLAPTNKLTKIGNKYGTMISCVTNVDGAIISEWILENGKKMKNVSTPQLFDNAADQVLAMLMNHDPNSEMPPLPDLGDLDLEFLKAMSKEIKINDDDTEAVKNIKQKVIDGREQMMEYLRQGISFSTIAKEHHELISGNVEIRNQCIREIQKYVDEGDIESAVSYRDKANEVLKESGIDEINMSLTPEEENENGDNNE